ncbi:MAG: DUF952 domain-containing protein [Actinomycetota bacterium]|nr:DUF952 domain-containing protein [Actinomycetota bacterium]
MRIFHVTTAAEWAASRETGTYRRSTRGASLDEIGFIHLSDAEQLPRVAGFLYRSTPDALVVLELESEEMLAAGAHLHWEDGGAGEDFPHLYGPIELPWVLTVWPAGFGADGSFVWPLPAETLHS